MIIYSNKINFQNIIEDVYLFNVELYVIIEYNEDDYEDED